MDSHADSAAAGLAPSALPTIAAALLALIFAAPTVGYRVELNSFSLALMEPVGLAGAAGIGWLAWRAEGGWGGRIKAALADPLTRFSLALAAALLVWNTAIGLWAGVVGQSPDGGWRAWMSDLRNWAVPILIFFTVLIGVHDGWRRWTALFVPIGLAQALLGLYQWATNSFRPFVVPSAFYKTTFTLDPSTNQPRLASFGAGLFSHPNVLGLYLALAFMVGLGWWLSRRPRLFATAAVAVIAAGLATTYAKASIAAAGIGVVALLAHQRLRANRAFALAGFKALLVGSCAAWLAISGPSSLWLGTFAWRVRLWDAALALLAREPGSLAVGGAMDDYARVAIYAQPHNQLFYLVLAYGLLGAIWLGLLIWRLHSAAWRMRRAGLLHREPLLAALWLSLWVFLAVGMLESPLITIEWRMILLLVVACFVGLRRETLRSPHAAV